MTIRELLHPARWPLRRRLVLSVLGLLAAASIVIGTVSVLVLQGFLIERLDSQLTATTGRSQQAYIQGPGGVGGSPGFLTLPGQRPDTLGAILGPDRAVAAVLTLTGTAKALSQQQVEKLYDVPANGKPVTVGLGGSLGDYRVVANRIGGTGLYLVTGLPLKEVQTTVLQLVAIIAGVTVAALALAFVGGTLTVKVALRPLNRVVQTASQVTELPLDRGEVALAERVPETDADPRTEVGRVGAALNRLLEHVAAALSARQASENKVRRFVADASHELRTPLTSIRGYAELTRRHDHGLPDDVVHSLGRIESEATRMTALVEDLLLLARLDAGRDLERGPVDLSRIVIDAVGDAHAGGPDHEWSLDLPDEPVTVSGDGLRLQQVVANVLANARVHTPPSTRVTTTLKTEGDHAVLSVEDDGPGIPADVQATLFERFARGDSSRSRAAGSTGLGSTGLGLAIVRAIVEGHRGWVGVESVPGRTVIRIGLPLPAAPPPPPPPA